MKLGLRLSPWYQYCNSAALKMATFAVGTGRVFLTWQRLMFRSYGGPTHRNVTSPRDRKMTSHLYSPRRTPLPSPTADPAPEALLTRSQFPTLSRQFIATIGTFEATRFFFYVSVLHVCVLRPRRQVKISWPDFVLLMSRRNQLL